MALKLQKIQKNSGALRATTCYGKGLDIRYSIIIGDTRIPHVAYSNRHGPNLVPRLFVSYCARWLDETSAVSRLLDKGSEDAGYEGAMALKITMEIGLHAFVGMLSV